MDCRQKADLSAFGVSFFSVTHYGRCHKKPLVVCVPLVSTTEMHTLEAKIKIPNTNIQFDRAIDHGEATLTTYFPHLTYETTIISSK